MFKLELIPTNMPRIIKLQYKAVLKSFFGNLKRRENKRNIKEATNGAIMIPNMLKKKINTTDDVLFNKFILFIKKFSFTKCGSRRYLSGFLAVFEERGEPACGRAAPIRQTYLCRRRRQRQTPRLVGNYWVEPTIKRTK